MIHLLRTDADNPDFQSLVVLLDDDLRIRDGEDHVFYAQFNSLGNIHHVLVAYDDTLAVGCGALRQKENQIAEVKRMFVRPEYRGRGIARMVLTQLEDWAKEEGFLSCILETGQNQPEAIRLYQTNGYSRIPNYGPYAGVENSICMKKDLF